MAEYDLSTDAGRMRALLDGKTIRGVLADEQWQRRLNAEGGIEGRYYPCPNGWCDWERVGFPERGGLEWSIVEPEPKRVEDMTLSELWGELLGDDAPSDPCEPSCIARALQTLVTEKRLREPAAKRDAELEAMTVVELRDKFWFGQVATWPR